MLIYMPVCVCMASVFIVSIPQVTCKCYVIAHTSSLIINHKNYVRPPDLHSYHIG